MKSEHLLSSPKRIRQNRLLHVPGRTIDLEQFLLLRMVSEKGKELAGQELNFSWIPERLIRQIYDIYGGEGLYQLTFLAMAHDQSECMHFIEPLEYILAVDEIAKSKQSEILLCDDPSLKQSPKLNRFTSNILQPSFSHKLYRAGRHHGSLVYGVGGPRILVSHPFQGRVEDIYDLYANSIDVVTSLCLRGYRGTFHFLDYIEGLNHEVEGMPAWLLWFSIIAGQSDLVIFVKEYEDDFHWAQKLEIEMTPDRVQKTVVAIPHQELTWAKKADLPGGLKSIYIGENGLMNEQEWLQWEGEHAAPFIQNYIRQGLPSDCLFVVNEAGGITKYPMDYPLYRDDQ